MLQGKDTKKSESHEGIASNEEDRHTDLNGSVPGKISMRKIIAALQTSVDGFIEGPNGELDWAMVEDEDTWREMDETLLGRHLPPGSGDVSCLRTILASTLGQPDRDGE